MKKVALINDLSGFGRCSLTVSIPIITAMGIQCCPLPTAILSNHTGYKSYFFDDYTTHIEPYYTEWKKLGLKFDMIYTGFLGSIHQIEIIIKLIEAFSGSLVLVDPVMGDNGKIYSTYTPEMCEKMKLLVSYSDIVTPNVTEALMLTDTPYKSDMSIDELKEIAIKISKIKPNKVIITGIIDRRNKKISNLIYDAEKNECSIITKNKSEIECSGTGDVFASVICGCLINGMEFKASVEKAATFVEKCSQQTTLQNLNPADGIIFEKYIGDLIK
jgi:pyridoxine kinase